MKKNSWFKMILILSLVMSMICPTGFVFADEDGLNPQIEVLPGLTVEVGEEVFFSGEPTTYIDGGLLKKARFEWDFGDGYFLKYGEPYANSSYSGIAAVHSFMAPGTYTVTLTVSVFDQFGSDGFTPVGDPVEVGTASVDITVTGQEPIEGFELIHAPFRSRLAQFVTAVIPEAITAVATNSLTVTVRDESGSVLKTLVDARNGLQEEEKFLLEQRNLSTGDYYLAAELKDAAGNSLSILKEKFSKEYDGVPTVSIDEWNSILINGEPRFITSSDGTIGASHLNKFSTEFNAVYCGLSTVEATPDNWITYINAVQNKGWMAIGPGRGFYRGNTRPARNSSLNEMQGFVEAIKNHESTLAWDWMYNNHLTGATHMASQPVLAAWAYATRERDYNHPVMATVDGKKYLSGDLYDLDFINSTMFGEKRSFYADILAVSGVYPILQRKSALLFNKERGVIDLWIQSIENFKERNLNAIPFSVSVEASGSVDSSQTYMESWLAAIHGAKMIRWYLSTTPSDHYTAMRDFNLALSTYEDIVLGPEPDVTEHVTDTSNERYNRVDTLTRWHNDYTYLFAARLTEPDPLPEETNHQPEPNAIETTFTVPGFVNGRADKLDKEGKIIDVLPVVNGSFTDIFNQYDVNIYRISDGDPYQNLAPKFKPIENKIAKTGVNLSFTVAAEDPDGDEENLVFSTSDLPEGANFNAETRTFMWTPQASQAGVYNVTFIVSDGVNLVEEQSQIEVIYVGLESIEVTTPPVRTAYFTEEYLDLDGLVVTGTFADGSTAVLPVTMEHISGFNSSAPVNDQVITITYEGETATFTIDIIFTDLFPHIEVRPGTDLEVNEEAFFTAEGSRYPDAVLLQKARFEWDFGDGYVMKYNEPYYYSRDGGMAAIHYYMAPGQYEVKLKVSIFTEFGADDMTPTGDPVLVRETSIIVNVTGEAPMPGFELLHAPFNARIAQFITALIPEEVASAASNSLTVTVEDYYGNVVETLLNKTGLATEERFLLEQRSLPKGDYYLTARIKDADGNVISIWKEKFSKAYEGQFPAVGIDEWNSIHVNGDPSILVTSFLTDPDELDLFVDAINSTYVIGYYDEAPNHNHTPELWVDYLNKSAAKGMMGAGPGRGTFVNADPTAQKRDRHYRNKSPVLMKEFVNAAKDHPALSLWTWGDEPNLGGRGKEQLPPVISAWTYATKEEDPNHPVIINLYGYNFLPYHGELGDEYDYINSTRFNGRHSFFVDILSMDIYPLNYRSNIMLANNPNHGVVDLWVQAIDNMINRNLNMVPFGIYIEPCNIQPDDDAKHTEITDEQVLMEAWLGITHGLKVISWFPHFIYNTIQYDGMREFTRAMRTFDDIILGPDLDEAERITDNSNVRNNRVDTLTKKYGDDIYLFAVRLTEPEPMEFETNHIINYDEQEYIETTFTVPGIVNGRVEALNEYGDVIDVLSMENGQFTDLFAHYEYKIYRINDGDPNVNLPPVFEVIEDKTVNAGTVLEFTVSAIDPNGDELTYSASNLPAGASFNSVSRTFSWTPQSNQAGTYNITFGVTDGKSTPVEKTIVINVIGSHDALAALAGTDTIQSESGFTRTLVLSNTIADVYAATFTLSYDSSLLALESVEMAADSPMMIAAKDISAPGTIRLSLAGTEPILGANIPLVDFHFRSKAVNASQTTSVSVTEAELGLASDGSEYAAGVSSQAILISLRPSAEVNNVSAVYQSGQVTITWTDPDDAVFGGVKIVGEGDTVITPVLADKGEQTAIITGLTGNTAYTFRVIALNIEGAGSQGIFVIVSQPSLTGDLNGDEEVSTGDLAMAARWYGAREGDSDWAAAKIADINGDKVVNIEDIAYIAKKILNIQ